MPTLSIVMPSLVKGPWRVFIQCKDANLEHNGDIQVGSPVILLLLVDAIILLRPNVKDVSQLLQLGCSMKLDSGNCLQSFGCL